MHHKGLSREMLFDAARQLIEEKGVFAFSMRALAERLGVKAASLYAHIENAEEVLTMVGHSALNDQKQAQVAAAYGKPRDDAVLALADAYRAFAKAHGELYRLIMRMPIGTNEALKAEAVKTAEPVMEILGNYRITMERRMHWQRVLRGIMHGFVSQEAAGYFSHYPVDLEESYHIAIQCVIDALHREEASNEGKQ